MPLLQLTSLQVTWYVQEGFFCLTLSKLLPDHDIDSDFKYLTVIIMDMHIPAHDIANMHAFSRYMRSLSLSFT